MAARNAFDRTADALGDRFRRRLLVDLLDHNPQFAAETVDGQEAVPGAEPDADLRWLELEHVHLPKLEGLGYVRWDRESGRITKGPNWEEIGPLVALLDEHREELPDDWL